MPPSMRRACATLWRAFTARASRRSTRSRRTCCASGPWRRASTRSSTCSTTSARGSRSTASYEAWLTELLDAGPRGDQHGAAQRLGARAAAPDRRAASRASLRCSRCERPRRRSGDPIGELSHVARPRGAGDRAAREPLQRWRTTAHARTLVRSSISATSSRAQATTVCSRSARSCSARRTSRPATADRASWDDAQDCRDLKALVGDFKDLAEAAQHRLRAEAIAGVLPLAEEFVARFERRTPRGGHGGLRRPAAVGARPAARQARRCASTSTAASRASSSTSSRTPTRCRRRSCCA